MIVREVLMLTGKMFLNFLETVKKENRIWATSFLC